VRRIAPHFQARLKALAAHPLVGEARGVGLVGAVELVRDKAAKTPFDAARAVGPAVQAAVLDEGVILRAIRDVVAVCPPLIITDEQIDTLFDALAKSLDKVHATLAAEAA
jgi:4-aminobutyrate---pyruvate transaminase